MNKSDIKYQYWDVSFKNSFLKECIEGFGAMNKNNYEVAIFNLLLNNDFKGMSDFTISTILRIPESKVKRLRYEAELVYPKKDEDLKEELYILLKDGSFKLTQDRIQFSIPNKMLRSFLNDLLLQKNSFSDSSFNSNIVSITPHALKTLLDSLPPSDEERESFIESVKKKLKDSEAPLKKTSKEKFIEYSKLILKAVGGSAVGAFSEKVIDELYGTGKG